MRLSLIAATFAVAAPAAAEVKSATSDSMVLEYRGAVPLPRAEAWARTLAIPTWWSDAHTYSGEASNMSLDPKAGGCWCETWPGGQVEHGRVLALTSGSLLRLEAALGPLQDFALATALTISLSDGADDGSTDLVMTYRANGGSASGLDAIAAGVDQVIAEQFASLLKP